MLSSSIMKINLIVWVKILTLSAKLILKVKSIYAEVVLKKYCLQ